jgi:predicted kinase
VKEFQKKPEIVVFAGPNGSGKSTFSELLKPPVDYINADEIKKNLSVQILKLQSWQNGKGKSILVIWKSFALKPLCQQIEI